MRKTVLALFLLLLTSAVLTGGGRFAQRRTDGYFFLPPRSIYYYQTYRFPVSAPYYAPRYNSRFYGRGYGLGGGYSGYSGDHGASYEYESQYGEHGVYRVYIRSPVGEVIRANSSDLIFDVDPPRARVYINDKLIGQARHFSTDRDRYMILEGEHEVRIELPGYESFQARLDIVPNKTLHLDIELIEKD